MHVCRRPVPLLATHHVHLTHRAAKTRGAALTLGYGGIGGTAEPVDEPLHCGLLPRRKPAKAQQEAPLMRWE